MTVEAERRVSTVFRVQFRCASSGALTKALTSMRAAGAELKVHAAWSEGDQLVFDAVCERAAEAALALREEGVEADVVTGVWVQTEDRPGVLGHLVQTLEGADVEVSTSYGATRDGDLCAVLATSDNPKAEDVLRTYLDRRG